MEDGEDRGIYEERDAGSILIDTGIFEFKDSITNSDVVTFKSSDIYNKDDVAYGLDELAISFNVGETNDYSIVVSESGDLSVKDRDRATVDEYIKDVEFNVFGTIDNKLIINIDPGNTELLGINASGSWYVYAPDEDKLYIGDDIISYVSNGSFTAEGFEYATEIPLLLSYNFDDYQDSISGLVADKADTLLSSGGPYGNVCDFSNSSAYVSAGNLGNSNGYTQVTISVWFKVPSFTGNDQYIISKDDSGNNTGDGSLLITNGGSIEFAIGSATPIVSSSGTSLADDEWHHVIFAYDSLADTPFCSLRVDGVNSYTNSVVSGAKIWDNDYELTFGVGSSKNSSYSFSGILDEIKIYNYSLTTSEQKAFYNNNRL